MSPAKQPQSHPPGGLAWLGRPRWHCSHACRSQRGTQDTSIHLPATRPSFCSGPLARSGEQLTETLYRGGIWGTALQTQALWPFGPPSLNLWPTECKAIPQRSHEWLWPWRACEHRLLLPGAGPVRGGDGPQVSWPPEGACTGAVRVSVTPGYGKLLGAGGSDMV